MLKRTCALTIAPLIFVGIATMAATAGAPAPQGDVINEARQKVLDGDRADAIKILNAALLEAKSAPLKMQLQHELTHLSQMFLTNEGQRKFELAESTRHSGRSGFLSQYEEALKDEPMNTKVLAGYVLGLLATKSCKKAMENIAQIEAIDASMADLNYLQFRAQLCIDPQSLTAKEDAVIDRDKFPALYRKTARSEEEFDRGNIKAALSLAREAIKIDNKFPQAYYWAYKAQEKSGGGIDEAQRYLYLCKGLTAETRRRYTYEPDLCTQTEEAEEYVRKVEAGKFGANRNATD